MAKLVINDVTSGFFSTSALNAAFTAIETAIENTVSRDGTAPNQMTANLDLNSHNLINGGTINATEITLNGTSIASNVSSAAASAASALASATSASASATSALASEIAATAVAGQLVDLDYVGNWVTATLYKVNNIVYESATGSSYICLVQHTSGVFNTDYTVSGYWGLLAAKGSAGAGTGDVVGPAASTDNSLARFDGVTGKLLKDGAVIGTHVQAYDATLTALAGTLTAANKIPYATALDTASELDLSTDVALGVSNTTLSTQGAVKSYVDTKADNLVVNATTAVPDLTADYLIFEDATDSTQKKATPISFNTLIIGTAQATTSGTTYSFTPPSWAQRITLSFVGTSFAAAGVARIRIGTGGVVATTGYTGVLYGITTTPTISSTALSSAPQGIGGFATTTAAVTFEGKITLIKHDGNTWTADTSGIRIGDGTLMQGTGSITLAGPLDIVSVIATTSTFDAGSLNILYE